jgi:hypothetical protein
METKAIRADAWFLNKKYPAKNSVKKYRKKLLLNNNGSSG